MHAELQTFLGRALDRLVRAQHDRHSAFRAPVLATIGLSGVPEARTVVLRRFDRVNSEAHIYTDARSPKVAEIRASPAVSLLFWDKGASLQVRASGVASVMTDGADIDEAKSKLPENVNGDYARTSPPGSPADDPVAARKTAADTPVHFARITIGIDRLDLLELDRNGHKRAVFNCSGEVWTGQWVVP